jgi:uncharacterized protein
MPEERPEEPENLDTPPPFFPLGEGGFAGEKGADYGEPIRVNVEGVYVAQSGSEVQRFVLLSDGSRRLPIVIGEAETYAITLPLERKKHGRPMTHDLMISILERLDVEVNRVVVDDLWDHVYYAKLFVRQDGLEFEIDSRPSDAIALAVRVDAPIFVADGILEQAGQ